MFRHRRPVADLPRDPFEGRTASVGEGAQRRPRRDAEGNRHHGGRQVRRPRLQEALSRLHDRKGHERRPLLGQAEPELETAGETSGENKPVKPAIPIGQRTQEKQ